jgi:hypothetical protein
VDVLPEGDVVTDEQIERERERFEAQMSGRYPIRRDKYGIYEHSAVAFFWADRMKMLRLARAQEADQCR